MRIMGFRLHLRAFALATAAMLASIFALSYLLDSASAQGEPDHSDLAHHHGFTGPGAEASWPPRPTGANSSMQPADAGFSARAFSVEAEPVPGDDGAVSDMPADIAAALGTDWLEISTAPAKAGKDDYTPAETTYFSRDKNQTVMVLQWPAGHEVRTFPPDQLQPVVTNGEEAEAAELGRTWLIEQGLTDVASLEGFGIRALDDGELYPVRMIYVTYAEGWFDDPLYSALVDLTNGVVVEGGAL